MLAPQLSLASFLQVDTLTLELLIPCPSCLVCSDHRKLCVKGVASRAASFSALWLAFSRLVEELNRFQPWRVVRRA